MRNGNAFSQRILGQPQAGNLRRPHHRRTALQFTGQIRQRHGLAQFHQAYQARERDRKARYFLRYGAHRSPRKIERFASRPPVRRWPRPERSTFLREFHRVALCPGGKIKGRGLRRISVAVSATAANGWRTTAGEKISSPGLSIADTILRPSRLWPVRYPLKRTTDTVTYIPHDPRRF